MADVAKIGILVGTKGRGSNMAAIIDACQSGRIPNAQVSVVVAPKEDAPALAVAHEKGVATLSCPVEATALVRAFADCDVICLAGFLKLLPVEVIEQHPGRVLNIHPALLPKFGGKGMYGMHVHTAVIAAQECVSGCTVHHVTPVYDEGSFLVQKSCDVFPDDTPETLAARVLKLEHEAYSEAICEVLRGG